MGTRPDIVPYCLRHEYCTELARRGVDIRIAQKLMGHADVHMTANIYTNLSREDVDLDELKNL
jgi:site-specific recombinase XerD